MKKWPFCSVVVLNYNGKRFLDDCFTSLSRIDYPKGRYEVIMADNGSRDDSVEFVKEKFPWVNILQLEENYGFAEGNNRAIEKARGEYVIFLNNDTVVDENWLSGLVKVAKKSERIGICGSKISDQTLGAIIGEGRLSVLGIPYIRSKHDEERDCFFVSGASLLIKKKVLNKLEFCFDPSYFAYFEDVDLCWRTKLLGYRICYAPESTLLHKGSGTSSKIGSIMTFYNYRNKIWTFKKNSRFPLTQIFMAPIFISTLLTMVYYMATKDWKYGIRVLKYIFSEKKKTPAVYKTSLKNQIAMFSL